MAEKTNPLLCKQCGYANEGERVYCHNCGTKLDRSLLPSTGVPEETIAKKQKRIRKIVAPKRGLFVGAGKAFVYTMLCAALASVLLLIALPQNDIPSAAKTDELSDMSPTLMLEDALQQTTPKPLTFKKDDINSFLAGKIKGAGNGMLGDNLKLVRVFVNLEEGCIRITADETLFGYHIYTTIYYKLAIANNKLQATVKGGNVGRLQIHPNMMKNLDSLFQKIWDSNELKEDKRLLDECQSVDVHKDEVDVVTQPANAMKRLLPPACALYFLLPAVLSAAMPFKQPTRSVSASGEFVIYCSEMDMRVAVSSFCEETKGGIEDFLGFSDVVMRNRWKIPIVINLLQPDAALPNLPTAQIHESNIEGGGRRIEVDIVLRGDLSQVHFQQQIVHAVLLEMEYRDKGEFKDPIIDPPEWLVEGLTAYLRNRSSETDVDVYKTLLDNNSTMPTVKDFLSQTTAGMNAASLKLYQAYSFSFLQLLAGLTDGQATLAHYIHDLPLGQETPSGDLMKHFPALGGSPDSLEKWWTLSMARIAASDRFKGLSLEETEQRLAVLLKFKIPTDKTGKNTKEFAIEDFKDFVKNPQAKPVLTAANGSLEYLATQANPLYRPIIADYMMIIGDLQTGKTKPVPGLLKQVGTYREMVLKRMDEIADYMNWFEATQIGKRSDTFDDYLQSVKQFSSDSSRRDDPLSQYLDSLEIEMK